MVGAFHDWHPMYIKGTGHSEGEGCEHIFSSSNELARSTRHATPFHRHQAIEQHFAFWDDDKYAALSTFLRNHYREALEAIRTLTAELSAQEREYLDGLKQPSLKNQLSIRYVEVLNELVERQQEWNLAREAANHSLVDIHTGSFNDMHIALNQARVRVDTAYSKLQNTEVLVGHMEIQLGIDKRWEIGSENYNLFQQEAGLLRYRAVLDELERLVVMRLFELSKLSLSGTGQ
ncbi:hypothetical protein M405DRAFT_853850 [Rhizopogon salebrosus TDB-379]|nr:hypothetical protein M405DRAFT_853850 [Rhizopogon salebrosus TDB-379]